MKPGSITTGIVVTLGIVAFAGIGFAARVSPSATREPFVVSTPARRIAPPPGGLPTPDEVGSEADGTVATVGTGIDVQPTGSDPWPGPEKSVRPLEERAALPQPSETRADGDWVVATAAATGVPARALQAYGDATVRLAIEDPTCRLGWNTLAGIGQIESGHGRAGLRDDGLPAAPIVGPALDGSPGRAAIGATAQSSAWHGDSLWDHAVGPMQFIPSTWYRWGADGDADGVADPQDIDDAALSAARYLCAGSRDLSTTDGWWSAILSYNHSEDYVAKVLAAANSYAMAAR